MGRIILASSSPRRQELIHRIGFDNVKIVSPKVEEGPMPGMPPDDLAAYWSRKKAESVAEGCDQDDVVIAGDTVVCFDGNILGKPADEADAFNMLTMLSGAWHTVYTGVTVIRGGEIATECEATSVLMRPMTSEEIEAYINTGEPLDKAGAYGVQERGALLCEKVEGDFYNVVGMPLFRLGRMLASLGIDPFAEE